MHPSFKLMEDLVCFFADQRGVTPEHEARHRPANVTMHECVNSYLTLGYLPAISEKVLSEQVQKDVAFIYRPAGKMRPQHNLELVPPTTPEHLAWLVPTTEQFDRILRMLVMWATPDKKDAVTLRQHGNVVSDDKIRNAMFLHLASGMYIQIIWRAEEMFPGTFAGMVETATVHITTPAHARDQW